ncbi:MAG: HAMP domain-containing histidine kinase [Halioglobus sp.]|nr:HAMP domain-containing histidine kinase [Halioglobus sp.]
MKFALSLRWFVGLAFLLLALALVAGYSMLSADYFVRGMDNITGRHMEQAAQRYLAATPAQRRQSETVLGYTVVPTWGQVPEAIRQQFSSAPEQRNELIKILNSGSNGEKRSIDFIFAYQSDGDSVYVTSRVSPETVSAMMRSNTRAMRHKLWIISTAIALALSLIIWFFLSRISRPISRLVVWTRSLNPQSLKAQPPDFAYAELNQLAQLIRSSLSSVQDSLDREQLFLRHTSHELRTPIAVIRNNVELLRKLQSSAEHQNEQQQQVIERIDRSSLTMKHLTETLLWLSRDDVDSLTTSDVALDKLVVQLATDMQYLLKEKPVEVVLDTQPCRIQLPEMVARIVLSNLIRNAFQYTWEGRVRIRQQGSQVEIVNPLTEMGSTEDLGFGLGLKLTEQLCDRLRWDYVNTSQHNERSATINFHRA